MPYGPRRMEEIRDYCEAISRFLIKQKCKAIVVACNTASAAALKYLREQFPELIIIGMEPAVKPAAASTRTGVIGIMATQATFQGRLFAATVGRHANHLKLINQICHGLAEHIETGNLDGVITEAMLMRFVQPMLDEHADTIVLACTHYPFILPTLRRLVGPDINVIDPAPAIARYLGQQLASAGIRRMEETTGIHTLATTSQAENFTQVVNKLLGETDCQIRTLEWGNHAEGSLDWCQQALIPG